MPLPPIAFYSIYEIAVRWGCHPADVAGWAAAGHLQVLAGIPPVSCGEETIAGLVAVPMAELMPMFRRYGPSEDQARLRRILPPGSSIWMQITDPSEGLPIRSSDLLLAAGSLQHFEEERDLLRRPAVSTGASPRYEWDAMYAWLTWFLYEKGIPDTKTALVVLVQDWFVQNSKSGEVPDESTIRKRLTSLWYRLRGEEPA
ncbi:MULTISPECIES: hypothetical protein [Ruegeria]|uniref:Uncharacterized protein n=2 Tax=Ruegeria TaxID=97050 RepID=A0A6B2NKI1_9RHOB|nr:MULTISPECIES: hypothetical protein [Ruegeria]MCE8514898.1 hypothetical protein [Ruegeria pomeroyi]MCG6560645.1 hypothetical protein [Ruegeria alba]NDW44621.1 hypothetical protein [Ruegeria sp. PrR005]